MLAALISAFTDSILKGVFNLISQELERRNLIAQGKAQQYATDLQATVKEATDAAQTREQVQAMPISAVDDDLERLRHNAAGHK